MARHGDGKEGFTITAYSLLHQWLKSAELQFSLILRLGLNLCHCMFIIRVCLWLSSAWMVWTFFPFENSVVCVVIPLVERKTPPLLNVKNVRFIWEEFMHLSSHCSSNCRGKLVLLHMSSPHSIPCIPANMSAFSLHETIMTVVSGAVSPS